MFTGVKRSGLVGGGRVANARFAASADADPIGQVLEMYRELVFRLAYHIVLDVESAHDVTQDVMLRAVRSFDKLSAHKDPDHWIRCVTVRVARTSLRRSRRAALCGVPRDLEESAVTLGDPINDLALRQVLAQLPVEHRTVLALAVGEQLSYAEIAAIAGIAEGTVGSRLNVAKALFRKKWEVRAV